MNETSVGYFVLRIYVHGELTHFSEGSLSAISIWKPDRVKAFASQIPLKSYFSGEIAGLGCLGAQVGFLLREPFCRSIKVIGQNELEKPPVHTSPVAELAALKKRMAEALVEPRAKESRLTLRNLNYLLFRCAATLISAPKVSISSFLHRQ